MPSPPRKPKSAEPRAVFVDTSGWIAFFSLDDRNHAEAEALVSGAVETRKRLITSNLVLAEVHRLLLFRAGIKAAVTALDRISDSPSVKVIIANDDHHRRARAWLDKLADQVITLTDAVSFSVMQTTGCRLALSYDHDFWTAGFSPFQLARRTR